MLHKFWQVNMAAWVLLGSMLVMAVGLVYLRSTSVLSSSTILYIVQPIAMAVMALMTHSVAGDYQSRVRHRGDKAILIGSILAIWFVLYMLTGLLVTFMHNSLVSSLRGILLNIVAFALPMIALEYSRFKLMLMAGRRNVVWFGTIVALVYTFEQIALTQSSGLGSGADLVRSVVGVVIPALVTSFLLTYLAISSGLASTLTFQLGVVAMTILPPFIPHYDWYMQGVTVILQALAVYVIVDKTNTRRADMPRHRQHFRTIKRAYNIMSTVTMVGLLVFMTGVFSYKPLVILSNSMVPVFSRGSVVIIEKVNDPMDVQEGDIVQYQALGHTITHRVVAIDAASDGSGERVFTTKGDNSPSNDPPVQGSQLLGIIRSQIPYVGYPTVWLHDLVR